MWTQDDYDPLDAFMADVQKEVVANKPTNRARPGLELDREDDHVADFLEAQARGHVGAPSAAAAGDGCNSDDDVYRTAAAVDAADKARNGNQASLPCHSENVPCGKHLCGLGQHPLEL